MKVQIAQLAGSYQYGLLTGEEELLDVDSVRVDYTQVLIYMRAQYLNETLIDFDSPLHYSNREEVER